MQALQSTTSEMSTLAFPIEREEYRFSEYAQDLRIFLFVGYVR